MTERLSPRAIYFVTFGALGCLLLLGGGWRWLTRPAPDAVSRGAERFVALGCVGCHGPGGHGGVPNPGSREGEIPGFTGGTAMMYVESEAEIREWILDSRPARLDAPQAGPDALIRMPAYRGRISEQELDDLVAYYKAVAWYTPGIPDAAREGRSVARRYGCFGCHGASGRQGIPNPGAFKGYIPGWGSRDYFELVRNEAELREWILEG
ncbi:MAG: hypothetical protein D6795_17870, partial [Deltaproteobacteria bacterium]